MGLEKLAREIEETARQSATMAEGVAAGLAILGDASLDSETARQKAAARIVMALQMQDRIEQRCQGIALAARALASQGEAVWSGAVMDELRDERYARVTRRVDPGDIELF